MILSMTFQCKLFFAAVLIGMLGGLAYSITASVFGIFYNSRVIKNFIDLLFWLVFATAVFLTMLYINYGEIRPFSIFGIALGMLIYHMTLSEYAAIAIKFIYKIIYRITVLSAEIILTPFKLFIYPFRKLYLSKFKPKIKKFYINAKKALQNGQKYEKMKHIKK